MRRSYLERVAPLGSEERPGVALVYMVDGKTFAPIYQLPRLALGREAEAHVRVFSRNPGLRKIYSIYSSGGCRYIVVAAARPAAVTPRSFFFYLFEKSGGSASTLSILLRNPEACVSQLVSVKTLIREMEKRRTGFIPVCRRGRVAGVAAAPLLASYLRGGGSLSARLASIKEYLEQPPRAESVPQLLRLLEEYSHGLYEPEPGLQLFVSENSLYKAARKLISKSLR